MVNPDVPLRQPEDFEINLVLDNLRDDSCAIARQRLCRLTRFDYLFIGIPLLLVVPLFKLAHLPLHVDFLEIATGFWCGSGLGAAFFAIVIVVIVLPFEQTMIPFLLRFRKQKGRIVIALALAATMAYSLGLLLGGMVAIAALGVAELLERYRQAIKARLFDIFFPALYLFCGLVLVLALNHALAGIRYAGTYDEAFDHFDQVLFHANVSHIAHWSLSHLPLWVFRILELVYYGLFGRLGAALILTALLGNQQYAIKYVRTLLVCYAIALVVFVVFPVKGPYSICLLHLSSYPRSLSTFWSQETILLKARALWSHHLTRDVIPVSLDDYYIGFPSLHTALPIVAVWFLRPWKKLALFMLFFYVALLIPAIVLLEWHYLVDIAGGVAAAFLAIWLTECVSRVSIHDESLQGSPRRQFAFPNQPGPSLSSD